MERQDAIKKAIKIKPLILDIPSAKIVFDNLVKKFNIQEWELNVIDKNEIPFLKRLKTGDFTKKEFFEYFNGIEIPSFELVKKISNFIPESVFINTVMNIVNKNK